MIIHVSEISRLFLFSSATLTSEYKINVGGSGCESVKGRADIIRHRIRRDSSVHALCREWRDEHGVERKRKERQQIKGIMAELWILIYLWGVIGPESKYLMQPSLHRAALYAFKWPVHFAVMLLFWRAGPDEKIKKIGSNMESLLSVGGDIMHRRCLLWCLLSYFGACLLSGVARLETSSQTHLKRMIHLEAALFWALSWKYKFISICHSLS